MATDTQKLLLAATIAHLLEYIDDGEPLDRAAAMSTLKQSDIAKWAEHNEVMLPMRRDGQPQWKRFLEL